MTDPFGTAALRSAALTAWTDSPTRLREDAAAEADLRHGGYRDRLWTELVQNAADAATRAGIDGTVTVRIDHTADAPTLIVGNTGAPLDAAGVEALAALRASDKTEGVGRYGVGFTAVTAVADEITVCTDAGGVQFSGPRTRAALAEAGLAEPDTGAPVLRLAWPAADRPEGGAATEVRLHLRPDVDADLLLADLDTQAPDLLLALPAVTTLSTLTGTWTRESGPLPARPDGAADTPAGAQTDDAAEGETRLTVHRIGGRTWWEAATGPARWLIEIGPGGAPRPPADGTMLGAPTPTDEPLSLPAVLITDAVLTPDRRRLAPGWRPDADAAGYPALVRALPAGRRTALVPAAGFPLGPVDAQLREAVLARLAADPWLPTIGAGRYAPASDPVLGLEGAEAVTAAPPDAGLRGGREALLLPGLTAEAAQLLADTVPDLVSPEVSGPIHRAALIAAGVTEVGLGELTARLSGLDRPPAWWGALYRALAPLAAGRDAPDLLGALPVPLTDGRTVTGPRTVAMATDLPAGVRLAGLPGLRLVHPDAADDLLLRLGAAQVGAADLLAGPELAEAIEHMLDAALDGVLDSDVPESDDTEPDDTGTDDALSGAALGDGPGAGAPPDRRSARALADTVLTLVAATGPDPDDPHGTGLPAVVGGLPLPAADGSWHPADELLAPGAPVAAVLAGDHPFAELDGRVIERHGLAAVRAVGVGWTFAVVRDDEVTGPDHRLDDEETWWDAREIEPETLLAARDLELVDSDLWPEALALLAGHPAAALLLAERDGYTAWWLRRHARIDGLALSAWAGPEDGFAGLLDPYPDPGIAGMLRTVLAGDRVEDEQQAQILVDRLAGPDRKPGPGAVIAAHRSLAEALVAERIELDGVDPPTGVRALSGAVIDPADALVVDRPHLAAVLGDDRLVPGPIEVAEDLAALLDVDVASARIVGTVTGQGRVSRWTEEPAAVRAAMTAGIGLPGGRVTVHEKLTVRVTGLEGDPVTAPVPWWRDEDGAVHVADTDAGWSGALTAVTGGRAR